MRIAHGYTQTTDASTNARGANATAAKAPPPPPPSSSAAASATKVSLSSEAKALATASASGGIDSAKVDRLKAAIQGGSFQVDSGAIANKIVNEGE